MEHAPSLPLSQQQCEIIAATREVRRQVYLEDLKPTHSTLECERSQTWLRNVDSFFENITAVLMGSAASRPSPPAAPNADAAARGRGAFAATTTSEYLDKAALAARADERDALRNKHALNNMARLALQGTPEWTIQEYKFLTPLVWAPLFPIIRMTTTRLNKRLQPWAIGFAIVVANLHGFWLIQNPDLTNL